MIAAAPTCSASSWAADLLDAFVRAGVTDVVISPGSRSTPFVLAAATHRGLTCHDVIDERDAAFFALGRAKVTGRPALLLCTSGTAAAHYLPVVIEASLSYTPLIALTADRPFELQDCGAAQTIDQTKLFGGFVRRFVELGLPDGDPAARRALARIAAQAVATSIGPTPGPVHLNARARKPLEPAMITPYGAPADGAIPPSVVAPDAREIDEVAREIASVRRGIIVCGPAPIAFAAARAEVDRLGALSGFPIFCEATSQLRFAPRGRAARCDAFDAFLGCERFRVGREREPELIVQLGATPTSASWERYVEAHPRAKRITIAAHGWPDPQGTARMVSGDVRGVVAALSRRLSGAVSGPGEAHRALPGEGRSPLNDWQEGFARANAAAWRAIDEDRARPDAELTDGEVARVVVAAQPRGGLLAVGNSLPVRLLDAHCPAGGQEVAVWSQRGASGIDGLIAGAAGAAEAWPGATTLLVGDVSFLHDLGGLELARRVRGRLTIVVINNDGGRIFEQLPVARVAGVGEEIMAHFTTPHGLGFEEAARMFGVAYACARDAATLREALSGEAGAGCRIVEARVAPDAARRQAERVRAGLEERL